MRRILPLLALTACNMGACPDLLYPYVDEPEMLSALEPLEGIGSLSAERCGMCHKQIYAEWSTSLMAQAETNPFFRAERAEQHDLFLCARCHYPLENQAKLIVTGLRSVSPLVPEAHPNPRFDEALFHEGVTCVVCHMSPELAGGSWDATTIFNARQLANATPPHPLAIGTALADPGKLCERCHQFDPLGADTDRPALDTHREHAIYRERGGKETCISCHMPASERRSVDSAPVRTGHDHRFRGARDRDFIRDHLTASVAADPSGALVVLENRTGHRLPTGDPSRVLSLEVSLLGTDGPVASRRIRILRDMDTIHVIDRFDVTLEPFEKRTISVPFSDGERAGARNLRLSVDLERYEADHPLIVALPQPVGRGALVTHVLTATVALGEGSTESRNVGRGGTSR